MPVTLTGVGHHFETGPWLFRGINARIDEGEVCALVRECRLFVYVKRR